jgi:hypothetical protein
MLAVIILRDNMFKIIITLLLLVSLTTLKGQTNEILTTRQNLLTKSNWYTDETLKKGLTMTFITHSSKDYVKAFEAFYKFNSDSSFLWRTTIDSSQQAEAGYDFWLFKVQWSLKKNGIVISLKGDEESNFTDTYKIIKLKPDTLVLQLLFEPQK